MQPQIEVAGSRFSLMVFRCRRGKYEPEDEAGVRRVHVSLKFVPHSPPETALSSDAPVREDAESCVRHSLFAFGPFRM